MYVVHVTIPHWPKPIQVAGPLEYHDAWRAAVLDAVDTATAFVCECVTHSNRPPEFDGDTRIRLYADTAHTQDLGYRWVLVPVTSK